MIYARVLFRFLSPSGQVIIIIIIVIIIMMFYVLGAEDYLLTWRIERIWMIPF